MCSSFDKNVNHHQIICAEENNQLKGKRNVNKLMTRRLPSITWCIREMFVFIFDCQLRCFVWSNSITSTASFLHYCLPSSFHSRKFSSISIVDVCEAKKAWSVSSDSGTFSLPLVPRSSDFQEFSTWMLHLKYAKTYSWRGDSWFNSNHESLFWGWSLVP